MKNLIYLLFISLSLILSACASFEDNKVTEVISLPDVSTYKNKPKVYIDFKYFMGNKNLEKATKNTKATEYLKPKIEEIIKESELFESYTFDEFEKDQMDYTLKLYAYNHANSVTAFMAGFVTGFTFFIVPTFATDHFVLRSSVSDIGGKSLRTVENNDSMKTWLGIWLIPAMGKTPAKALTNTVENQIKDALKTHVERGNLKYSETSQYYLMRGKG